MYIMPIILIIFRSDPLGEFTGETFGNMWKDDVASERKY
jgi:hypothetical protein